MGWLGFVGEWRAPRDDQRRDEVYLGLERPFAAVLEGRSLRISSAEHWPCYVTKLFDQRSAVDVPFTPWPCG